MRGAIAGCGFFGHIHLEAWSRMDGVKIVAACDAEPARAQAAAPRGYRELDAMLDAERPDFLDIATRPELHLPMVLAAAQRGIPVICQKPLAPSWPECIEIVNAAEAAGIPFMVHENWRWQPWYRQVKKRIETGDIGEPVTYTFRTRRNDGDGLEPYAAQPYFREMPRLLAYETLIHPVDTSRFLFGEVARVQAHMRRINPAIKGEDQVLMILTHTSGLAGVIDGHRFLDLAPESPPLGDATFDGHAAQLRVMPTGDLHLWNGSRDEIVWRNTATAGYRGDSVRATCQHFIDELRGARNFETSGRQYLRSVDVIEQAYSSTRSPSELPPTTP